MKKILPIALLGLFVSDAFADDWRMRKFDADQDGFVIVAELKGAGCVVKPGLFKHADKNKDGKVDEKDFELMRKGKNKSDAAEYQGRKVTLNKPFRTPDGPKKSSVYVKNEKGNVVKVNFGDPNMEIKRDNPKRRKSFRARHNCSNPGPKWKARYWSCKAW